MGQVDIGVWRLTSRSRNPKTSSRSRYVEHYIILGDLVLDGRILLG